MHFHGSDFRKIFDSLFLLFFMQFLVESLHSRHASALRSTPDQGSESANQRELALDILAQIAHAFDFPDLHRFLTVCTLTHATTFIDTTIQKLNIYVFMLTRICRGPSKCCCLIWQQRQVLQAPPSFAHSLLS